MAIRSVFEYLLKSINIPLCSVFRLLFIPFFPFPTLVDCFMSFLRLIFLPISSVWVLISFRSLILWGFLFHSVFVFVLNVFLHFTHFDVAPKSIRNYLRLFSDTCQNVCQKLCDFFSFLFFSHFFHQLLQEYGKWRFKYVHLNLSNAKWQQTIAQRLCIWMYTWIDSYWISRCHCHAYMLLSYTAARTATKNENFNPRLPNRFSHDQFERTLESAWNLVLIEKWTDFYCQSLHI